VTGTGATRSVAFAPTGVGHSTITLNVTAAGGKTTSATFDDAASANVFPGAHWLWGYSDLSTAIDVGGGYILAGDDETGSIGLYDTSRSGPPVKVFDIQGIAGLAGEMDFEAAAQVGDLIYWSGSMGNDKSGNLAPSRNTVIATKVSGSGANTTLTNVSVNTVIRPDVIAWDDTNGKPLGLAAAAAAGVAPKDNGGFNIEGLEFAPGSTSTAYLGFRNPIVGGKALMIPGDELRPGGGGHRRARVIVVSVRNADRAALKVRVRAQATIGGKQVTIATRTVTVKAGRSAKVALTVSKAQRAKLGHQTHALSITATSLTGKTRTAGVLAAKVSA
jgi:hypothetical protein